MNRRSVLRHLAIVAGGIVIFPSCLQDQKNGKASIKLNKLSLDIEQEHLLCDIAETIIPATDTPGAKALNLHLFVMKMVDDCYEKEDQQKFIKGLKQLDEEADRQYSKSFSNLANAERKAVLLAVEGMDDTSDMVAFYKIMKKKTIQGYLSSKYYLTNLNKYQLIPGRYNGYFPANI